MTMSATGLVEQLRKAGNPEQGRQTARFFKPHRDRVGNGWKHLGVRMPVLRQTARQSIGLPLKESERLLRSEFHEGRILALLILVEKFQQGSEKTRQSVAKLYLRRTRDISSWALVDCSAHLIMGPWLEHGDRKILDRLARSDNLWERRIAMITTFHFIRRNDFDDALRIAGILVNDSEDLIHKAVGWMLREVGNRSRQAEEVFLRKHYNTMPRTMLRYAIEKFPESLRRKYLAGTVHQLNG